MSEINYGNASPRYPEALEDMFSLIGARVATWRPGRADAQDLDFYEQVQSSFLETLAKDPNERNLERLLNLVAAGTEIAFFAVIVATTRTVPEESAEPEVLTAVRNEVLEILRAMTGNQPRPDPPAP